MSRRSVRCVREVNSHAWVDIASVQAAIGTNACASNCACVLTGAAARAGAGTRAQCTIDAAAINAVTAACCIGQTCTGGTPEVPRRRRRPWTHTTVCYAFSG